MKKKRKKEKKKIHRASLLIIGFSTLFPRYNTIYCYFCKIKTNKKYLNVGNSVCFIFFVRFPLLYVHIYSFIIIFFSFRLYFRFCIALVLHIVRNTCVSISWQLLTKMDKFLERFHSKTIKNKLWSNCKTFSRRDIKN